LPAEPARQEAVAAKTPAPIKVRSSAKIAPAYVAALRARPAYATGSNGEWKEF
jgi:hypothetical protein